MSIRPEHIPVDAYRLLRRIAVRPLSAGALQGPDDDAALGFLLTNGLAERSLDGDMIGITDDGKAVGRLMHGA